MRSRCALVVGVVGVALWPNVGHPSDFVKEVSAEQAADRSPVVVAVTLLPRSTEPGQADRAAGAAELPPSYRARVDQVLRGDDFVRPGRELEVSTRSWSELKQQLGVDATEEGMVHHRYRPIVGGFALKPGVAAILFLSRAPEMDDLTGIRGLYHCSYTDSFEPLSQLARVKKSVAKSTKSFGQRERVELLSLELLASRAEAVLVGTVTQVSARSTPLTPPRRYPWQRIRLRLRGVLKGPSLAPGTVVNVADFSSQVFAAAKDGRLRDRVYYDREAGPVPVTVGEERLLFVTRDAAAAGALAGEQVEWFLAAEQGVETAAIEARLRTVLAQ